MKRGIILLAWVLAGCGGGGSASDFERRSDENAVVAASLSAKPLAGNQASLDLAGAPAGRYCIRQVTEQPLASDSCFSDQLQQVQTIANPSDTARATFTAWVLSNTGTVSRHASVSLPGKTCSAAAYAAIAGSSLPAVCIITSAGESVLTLEPVKAPVSTANFLRYVNQGFYDQTVFHRFLKVGTRVVQGGGVSYNAGTYVPKVSTLPAIALESPTSTGLSNTDGTIAMARTDDLDSATSGFFVNISDNSRSYNGARAATASPTRHLVGSFMVSAHGPPCSTQSIPAS
jgi:cyclophilin family peptidyl-prolyl cis-trans isomerase